MIGGPGSILRSGGTRSVTTFACWRANRSSRTGRIRMADTRVMPVPAVATLERWLSVARATAERPVHERTRRTDRRGVTRSSLDCSSTLRSGAIMGVCGPSGGTETKSRASDAAPSETHSPFRQSTRCAVVSACIGDATPCTKHSPKSGAVNRRRALRPDAARCDLLWSLPPRVSPRTPDPIAENRRALEMKA
jgi:hypothetical protein